MPLDLGSRALLRALVVDRNRQTRERTRKLLRQEGFDSAEAEDGIEALQHASVLRVDLVVTDIEMPRMSGYELVELIGRGVFGNAPPPIIVCSNEDVGMLTSSPWLRDVAAFVAKPVDPGELRFAIAKAFEQ